MGRTLLIALLLCAPCAGPLVGESPQKDKEKDADLFQGTWRVKSYTRDGKALTANEAKKIKLIFKGNTYARDNGTASEQRSGTIRLDPSKEPKQIDFVAIKGPNKGKTLPGIYKVENGVLTICSATGDKDRPTKFESKPGSGYILGVYTRE